MIKEIRYSSHWVCAQQFSGKSYMLTSQLDRDIQEDCSIITLDSKGDLTKYARRLALGNRLIVLDPIQSPFAINPFDVPKTNIIAAIDQILYLFSALLETSISPMQQSLMRPIIRALIIGHPQPTLETFQECIYERMPPEVLNNIPPDLARFFKHEWDTYTRTRSEIKWRLQLLAENDALWPMLTAPKTRYDIVKAMDGGFVTVIDNSQATLGELGCSFLGRFFLSRIWAAATARAFREDSQKKPVVVYVDEAQLILDKTIEKIIFECRSAKIALILSHQAASQIKEPSVRGALESCAIKTISCHKGELDYFSKLLDIPQNRMKDLPQGQFATDIKFQGPSILQVPKKAFTPPTMTPQEEAALKARMKRDYGIASIPPTDLIVEIPKRNNHFTVDAVINGISISMMVDTGATITSLTQRAARAIGIPLASLNYSVLVNTANGTAFWAPYTLDQISIGPITQACLDVLVSPDESSFSNLLGMNFLRVRPGTLSRIA